MLPDVCGCQLQHYQIVLWEKLVISIYLPKTNSAALIPFASKGVAPPSCQEWI